MGLFTTKSSHNTALGCEEALPQQISGATGNWDLSQELESESLGKSSWTWKAEKSNGDVGAVWEAGEWGGPAVLSCAGTSQRKPLVLKQNCLMSCCWGYPSHLHKYKVLLGPGMELGIYSRQVPKRMQKACHSGLHSRLLSLVLD